MTESNQLFQLLEIKGELMLKTSMQEMIELMFYPDDYDDMMSSIVDNFETGMYISEENDTIDNVINEHK